MPQNEVNLRNEDYSGSSDGHAAVRGQRDLIYSGDVSDHMVTFLWDNLIISGRLTGKGASHKEGRRLILNSRGGDLYAMLSIIDLFEEIDDLSTVSTGSCMSAAVPIVAAGTPGKRVATRRTRFMIHPPSAEMTSSIEGPDVALELKEMQYLEEAYASVMSRYCEHSKDWWLRRLRRHGSYYFTAIDAKRLGIIDKILPDRILGKVQKLP